MKGNFLNELQKRGVNIADTIIGTEDPRANSYLQEYKKRKKQEEELGPVGMVGTLASLKNDIGPVKDDEGLDFFQKGAFSDGYQFGDVAKTILGTAADLGTNVVKGAGGLVEGVTDLAQYGVAAASDLFGADRAADKIRAGAKKNLVEDFFRPADEFYNKYSVLGRTSDAIAQGIGQVGTIMLTGGLAGAAGLSATAVTTGAMGLSGMGSGMSQAYQEGASDGEAMAYGAIAGAADAITELIFGGMGKAVNAVGFSKGLSSADDMLAKKISSKISSQLGKNLAEFGVKASGEGFEEVLAGVLQAAGKKATYMSEKEFSDILEDENLLEQFVVGAMTSGAMQSGAIPGTYQGSLIEANKQGKDFITGQTVNEQAVIKKEIEKRIAEQEKDGRKLTAREKSAIEAQVEADLPKGYISTDTIEEVLGGDDFKTYKDTIDSEEALKKQEKDLTDEYNLLNKKKLGDMTGEETDRRDSLKTQIAELQAKIKDTETNSKRDLLKAELSKKVFELSKSDRLVESYLEPVRAKQKFTADLNKYEGKAKEVIQQVMDSGLADNSNRTHDFWDLNAKLAAKLNTNISIASDQQIREMVKAQYEADGVEFDESKFKGQRIDGIITKDGIVLNAESERALNFVVGHEITHEVEQSNYYSKLQDALMKFAGKEFDSRFEKRMAQYKGKYSDAKLLEQVKREVTADLVGDYLFTDENFIKHLASSDRNVFQKIYDEVKHLLKLATAGSKEARELERVKHLFDKALNDTAAKNNSDAGNLKENNGDNIRYAVANKRKGRYNKRSKYSETESLFLQWESGSAPVGEVRKFARSGKLHYYEKTESGCVELSKSQYNERNGANAENIDRRAERRFGTTYDYDGSSQRASLGSNHSNRNARGNATVFGQAIREKLSNVTAGSERSTSGHGSGNAVNQSEYTDEASDKSGASFITFSNDYATTRNFMKEGDASKETDAGISYSLSDLSEADQAEAKKIISNLKTRAMASKYGFNSYGSYTAERMDREIRTSSSDTQMDYAKSYITWVEPDDFIYATTGTERYREQLKEEAGELDLERLKNETQPIRLTVDFETGEIVGHEGRHRMLALKAAGVEKVAVIIDAWNDNRSNTKPVDIMRAKGQRFSAYAHGQDFYLHNMLPLSKRYADTAKALFTNKPKSGVQFSLSDTEGRQLSKEQQEYFKDSKVRDADGNLKVMYHGTPNGDFTVFKDGAYFTDNKAYADRYQSASASSISSGKTAAAPKTFEVYLDIKKPFDLNDAEARSIYINEYIKGGNAIGINPYLSDAEYDKIQTIDWTEGEDLRDFLIDNGYDYDGLVLDEGADGGYGDAVEYRGTSYVTFSPEQVKAVDNAKPTADPGIRFALSDAVEETKDLMALHNLQASELLKSLGLGGLPMPSIAVIKAEAGHDKYGDVSLILPKNVIDPKANKYNKVYGGDAWTPTYPKIEYKPNKAVQKKISDKYYGLANKLGYDDVRPLYSYVNDLERELNYAGGEAALLEQLYEDSRMMNVYLADSGKGKVEPIVKETRTEASEAEKEVNQWFVDKLGEDVINQIWTPAGVNGIEHRKAFMAQYGAQAEQAYRDMLVEKFDFSQEDVAGVLDNTEQKELLRYLRNAAMYLKNGGVTVKTETDYQATEAAIREAAADGYKEWVDSLFKGIEEKSGIRNNQDYYTPSGNPRSWDALHWENTLENVVKAMRGQDETGVGSYSPYNSFASLAQKRYGSIAEIKADSDRLSQIPEEEYEAMGDAFANRLIGIADSIKDPAERNPFIAADEAAELIVDAVRTQKTKAGMLRYMQKWNSRVTEQTVEDIAALVSDIANMPTGYFEAKPQRAVSFDEVGVFVIPRNADVKLKQELLNKGYSIAEYDPNVEGDRSRVVNSFEEYKFSLSNVGEEHPVYGTYHYYSRYNPAAQGDIAPVASTQETAQDILPDDYAPMTEEETAARQSEILDSLTDEDAPAEVETEYLEMADTQPLTQKVVKDIVRSARGILGLSNNQVGELYSIVLDYNGREFPSREALFQEVAERFGQYTEKGVDEDLKAIKAELRTARIKVDDAIKNDITDYGQFKKRNFGKIRFSNEGLPVDVVYMELAEKYPGYFPEDIIHPSEQLQRMAEIAGYDHNTEQVYELDDDTLLEVTDSIIRAVNEFRASKRAAIAQKTARESFNSLMPVADEYAPPMDGDIGPVAKPASVRTESTKEKKVGPRQALHQRIIDNIKTRFAEKGFDFDSVLKKAKNLSTFATVDNTPQRVMEKALGYKEGQVLSDITVNQVARNETEGIKWLNKYTDRKNGLLKQISDQYNIKPGSKESAAAQMYAEGFYVAENNDIIEYGDRELAKDFPDARVQANIKGLAKDPRIRQIYDETLALINDSRTRNAYPEIQKLENYFLHFRAMGDTFSKLGLPFNPNDIKAKDLPTDLNGVTADLKPGQPYFASANHRTGQRTSFDLLGGLEMYLTSAKGQIYHIDDIQTLRALRNYIADTYGQANGLEGLDNLTEEEVQDRIEQVYGSHLSTFAKFLNEEANVLAGKTALIDRGLEGIIGRRGMTFLETVNRQVGANMVGYNVSSSLTNFLAPVQAFAKTNKADFMKAFSQTVYNKLASINGKGDGFAEQSPVMIRRKGADRFHRTFWQKLSDPGYALMGAVDSFSTELIARAKYNEFTRKGMDAAQAHIEADKWTSRLMGDRSLGQQPHLYNSKMLGIVTKFQLEVRNQLDSQFYDTIQEAKVSNEDIQNAQERNAKTAAKVASTFFSLAVGQHLFGKAFESIAGYNPAFDIIEALVKAFGWDDDEEDEDTVLDNIGQGFMSLMEDMPYSSVLTGGRIPIQSALPISEFFKGKDQYGNEKSRLETLSEAAPYYLLPGGYGQIKKTVAGLNMFSDEHPVAGSYTDSGNLRFPVEDTLLNRAQAAVFGQYASSNARDYFDNERQSLKKNQIQEFVDVDIPIRDYWAYRDGLKKQETLEDKFDYIAGLDLPISKKNILINNVVDRKEPVDLSDYDAYSGYEEFDFATKNPEKYAFFEEVGISYSTYKNGDDDTKDAYDWAYNNPDKYLLSKAAASDVVEYRRYAKDLYDIKADKDASGKTISGSRKEKVIQYLNNLDIDYGERLILFKSEYEADDTYNADIVEYLNGRDDISFEEEVTILKELGFIVLPDGTVQW